MNSCDANAYYLLPTPSARQALRSALMAMHLLPGEIAASRHGLEALRANLARQPDAVGVIDLQAMLPAMPDVLQLSRWLVEPELRQRIILSRHDHGPVWDSLRDWTRALGFRDLVAHVDTDSLVAESQPLLEHVAVCTGAGLLSQDRLKQYFSAMQARADGESSRGLIRALTGCAAETLCLDLASHAGVRDRRHNLTTYPSCFAGGDAVTWMASQFALSRVRCVQVGQALQSLALLHHVVHEKPFADANYFYRLALCGAGERIPLQMVLERLIAVNGVKVQDRLYHGRTFEACFVGAEAIDCLNTHYGLRRHECETLLNRLHGFGLIEHVTKAHPVRDGNFFYRFADSLMGDRLQSRTHSAATT